MKHLVSLYIVLINFSFFAFSQSTVSWQYCFGGSDDDMPAAACMTLDGQIVITGNANSEDGDLNGHILEFDDIWRIHTDSTGVILSQTLWNSLFLGNDPLSIEATSDSGYIEAGRITEEYLLLGYTTNAIIRKYKKNGVLSWAKVFGGSSPMEDTFTKAIQANDGGYMVAGYTNANMCSNPIQHFDMWVLKLDSSGNMEWQSCIGRQYYDHAYDIAIVNDTNYLVCGETEQTNYTFDGWLVKLDSQGEVIWEVILGGSGNDRFTKILKLNNGDYLVGGTTGSNNGNVSGNHGMNDVWLTYVNSNGQVMWNRCFGGSDSDIFNTALQTDNDNILIFANTRSSDGNVPGNNGNSDIWVFEMDTLGNPGYGYCIGGSENDYMVSAFQKEANRFIIAGGTYSALPGHHGGCDYWISGTDYPVTHPGATGIARLNVYPNPSSEFVNIELPETTVGVEIFKSTGMLVKQISRENQRIELSVKDWPEGMYLVKIITTKGVVITKFVKSK